MTSILKADTIQDTDGNNIINESSDTITIGASGDTTNIVGTLQNNGSALISGITEADQWRYTTDLSIGSGDIDLTSNLERIDTSGQQILGTGMTESSGIFTFPSTGIWYIISTMFWYADADTRFIENKINLTINNSSYNVVANNAEGVTINGGTSTYASSTVSSLVDVTDTSNVKIKFTTASQNTGGSVYLRGNTSYNRTVFTFIRIGDT